MTKSSILDIAEAALTADVAHAILDLNPSTGRLTWKVDRLTRRGKLTGNGHAGMVAAPGGALAMFIPGTQRRFCYSARRVVWLLSRGAWPLGAVVPINGVDGDMRPDNLRDCGAQFAPKGSPRLSVEDALTADEARAIFDYDPATGGLTWNHDRRTTRGYINARAGSPVGGPEKKGYLAMSFQPPRSPKSLYYFVHRIVWLIVTGKWPEAEVDHRNGDKADNRWDNLRHADDELNSQNRRRANKNNSTGMLGVTFDKASGKYDSRIGHRRKLHKLGKFDTPGEAHQAYVDAKRLLHAGGTL